MKQAVGYLRRSTDRQTQSIPDQRKAIEGYATEEGFEVLGWYIDDAVSGTSTKGRKEFLRLIDDAQKQNGAGFRYILTYDVKRFGRVDNDEAAHAGARFSRKASSPSTASRVVINPSR